MEQYTAKCLGKEKYALGESPYYDPATGYFSWVDIINNRFYIRKSENNTECFELGQPIGAAIPRRDGGYLLAARDGMYVYRNGRADLYLDLKNTYKPYWRSNDAKADPMGRIFFGASVEDEQAHGPEGALFCYDNGSISIRQDNTKISNGMAWSSDRKSFYFSDSLEHAVFRYDYDEKTGTIGGRRVLFEVENGVPDGMCIDSEDNLWLAVWGGNRIEKRSGASGEKLGEIYVPAKQTSSCCFGDRDLKTLFITSAGVGLDGEYDGCLFAARLEVCGVAPDYAGF